MDLLAAALARRRWIVGIWLLIAAWAAPGLLELRIDNSPEVYFVRDAEALARFERFARAFGAPRTMRVVLFGGGLWTREGLEWLARLEEDLPALPGVVAATGLAKRFRPEQEAWPPDDPAAFRERVRADRLSLEAGWLGADGESASILLALRRLTPAERRGLLSAVERRLEDPPDGVTARGVGLPLINRALDEAILDVAKGRFPLLAALALALLAWVFRSAGDVLRALLLVAYCLIVTFGAMGRAGASLNFVTSVLPPLLFVLVTATAIHVSLRFRAHRAAGLEPPAATLATYREKAWPVLWTGLTTWVGFGSLALSPVPPVRSLGLWSAFGIMVMTVAAMTLYPALLAGAAAGRRTGRFELRARGLGRGLGSWAVRSRRAVALAFAGAAALLLGGTLRLESETGVLNYFRPDHPLRAEIESVEARRISVISADLVLAVEPSDPPLLPRDGPSGPEAGAARAAALVRLDAVARRLREEPLVLGALSVADVEAVRAERRAAGFSDNGVLRTARNMLLDRDGRTARVAFSIPLTGEKPLRGLFARAERLGAEVFPEAEAWVTGRYPLVLAAQRHVFRTMVLALGITLLCVAAVLLAVLRRPRLAVRALLPNLWPVVFVLGLMGWLRIPLDSGTVMIASIALGLAVDDTLHFLGRFRLVAASEEPAAATLESTAGAHLLTSLVLAGGFTVCAFSSLVPVARFGALSAAAIAMALAADLLLLPALFGRLAASEAAALAPR